MAHNRAITRAAETVVTVLRAAVSEPGTASNRAAAEAIVKLRKQFSHEGLPDWAGRSPGYRDLIERLYRQAEVPSDSEDNMQANIRYHLGNVLRTMAPVEDLEALGLATQGPLGRVRDARAGQPKRPKGAAVKVSTGDQLGLAALALTAIRTLRTMEPADGIHEALKAVIDEAVDAMGTLPNNGGAAEA